ncbi:MAG: STAS domain-containing protein [Spirochaetia bacterium]|nr:STAS domain-containing protein [Spirochaetia bacterium]MBR5017481.1 STAS domain-containing protein [Spirochaetia bacterium]
MELTSTVADGKQTIALSGELNTLTSPELSAAINAQIDKITALVLDFNDCDYVSSAGIRVLLSTFKTLKQKKASMKLINVGENFKDVLESTCLDGVFDIEWK